MINALLVRWSGGWAEVLDAASITARGRSEALLGLGAAQSIAEVERVAAAQLATYASPRTEVTADLIPIDETDTPYLAFRVGDSVTVPDWDGSATLERIVALTVAEDENGQVTYSPELKDLILTHQERLEQAMKKMADGTLRGNSAVATPAAFIPVPKRHPGSPAPALGTVATTNTTGYPGHSDLLDSVPYGTAFELGAFTVSTTSVAGPGETIIELWQSHSGSGDVLLARAVVADGAAPGDFTGAVLESHVTIASGDGIWFNQDAGRVSFTARALFGSTGDAVTLTWRTNV